MFRIDIYHHIDSDGANRKLDHILAQLGVLMATVQDIKKLVSDLDSETNAVAAKVDAEVAEIKRLSDLVAAGTPVSQQDLDDISAGLTPISDRLKVIGSDPTNPIPPAP